MNFAKNIKFLRKRRGRTQDDVASALGLKRSTLSGYENNVAEPGIEVLIAFSKYFEIAVDTLLKMDWSTEQGIQAVDLINFDLNFQKMFLKLILMI